MTRLSHSRITAVIPAHNEEKTIGAVIDALKSHSLISEVIVVNDRSTDATGSMARSHGARVIDAVCHGKGAALEVGAKRARTDYVLMCDADVVGLEKWHIAALAQPALANGNRVMTVGIRDRGGFLWMLTRYVLPFLGGERVLPKTLLLEASNRYRDFGVETALNALARAQRIRIVPVRLSGVSQVVKEKKYGLQEGVRARLGMIWHILKAEISTLFFR